MTIPKSFKTWAMHAIEAMVVVGIAILIAQFFPEATDQVIIIAVGALSLLAKSGRDTGTVPDYVHGDDKPNGQG